MLHRFVVTSALLLLALGLGAPALAQEEAAMPEPGAEQPSFSDDQLEAFADVAVDVQSVIAEARPKIAAAESQEAGQAVVQETNAKIMGLIEEHPDISFDEYRAIAMRTEQDPEFKARVDAMVREGMQEAMQEGGAEGE
ncbi:MAG: DUF4168 domain-containing protein [Myxococcota bacterium]|nr:DUF4168 domain-containing protein [Myxococcota bacterium]